MNLLRPTLLALSCLFASQASAIELPSIGDTSSSIISLEQEHRLGRAWLNVLRSQLPRLEDPLLKDYVERSVYRLAETSQLQDRRLEFVIIASPQLNAFAAPGGIIGVNGGLFIHAQTEAEYASVMAHELAHLSQRHFARGLEAQRRSQLPMMAALLAGVVAAAAGAGDAAMASIMSGQAATFQEQRRFSRQNEQEADRIGLQNLSRAGFDPRSMPSMFERLARQYSYDRMPPEFLLTHPVTQSRIADTRNRAEQIAAMASRPGTVDSLTYQLLRTRIQLTFEDTPGTSLRNFRAELEATEDSTPARYGLVLALIRANQLSEAERQLDLLLNKAPNNPFFILAKVDLEISQKRLKAAEQRINRALQTFPSSYPLKAAKANVLFLQQRYGDSAKVLEDLQRQRSHDPDIWFELAEARGMAGDIIGLHEARAEYFVRNGDYHQAIEQLGYAKRRAGTNFPLSSRIDARQAELIREQQMIDEMFR